MKTHRFKVGDVLHYTGYHHRLCCCRITRTYYACDGRPVYNGESTIDGGQTWWKWEYVIAERDWRLISKDELWPMYVARQLVKGS